MPVGEAVHYPQVAVRAPATERAVKAAAGVSAVAQVPPDQGVKLGSHELAKAVGVIHAVDEAGGLLALRARVAVVLGADQFDVRPRRAEIVCELLPQVGGVQRPLRGTLEQKGVAVGAQAVVAACPFGVVVMDGEVGVTPRFLSVANMTAVQP